MVNELRDLLRESVTSPPPDGSSLDEVVSLGRRRVRRRRSAALGGLAATVAGVVAFSVVLPGPDHGGDDATADLPGVPAGPVLRLADAEPAVAGRDYELLASHTNQDLESGNGQYFEGVTDDGLIVFRDGPRDITNTALFALMDPATGEKDWLPRPPAQVGAPIDLTGERLVFAGGFEVAVASTLMIFDRSDRTWRTLSFPGLPDRDHRSAYAVHDGRLYVGVSHRAELDPGADAGDPAEELTEPAPDPLSGGDHDVDDSGATGEQLELWSASLDDPSDVRDEELAVGDFAFDGDHLVWTDVTNGVNDRVHVRDLTTGEDISFDPRSGDRCNQLSLAVAAERIVLSQYCGDVPGGRDDRVQVLTMAGEPVVTIQDSLSGWVPGGDHALITGVDGQGDGAYVYDLVTGRFLRLSSQISQWALDADAPAGQVIWNEPAGGGRGATQKLARLLP